MTDPLYKRFKEVLKRLSLAPNQQIVIALGGGADSQALLDCTMRFRQDNPNYRYLAVHLDHGFHPDSAAWSSSIEAAVAKYSVDMIFEPLVVTVERRQSKEAAGREQRYQRLCELSDDDAVILLGQHRNDQIETFLLQLNRGSGPKGLSAMAEVHYWHQQRRLVRPLLTVSKTEIYQYAKQHQLHWIEDDTNYDTRIERNFLRHDVIPLLEQRWPQFGDSVLRSANLCAEQQQVLEQLLDDKLKQQLITHPLLDLGLPVDALRNSDDATQRALIRRWIERTSNGVVTLPSYQQLEQIRQQAITARADTKMQVQCAEYTVHCYQMALWVSAVADAQNSDTMWLDEPGCIQLPSPWGRLVVTQSLLKLGPVAIVTSKPAGKFAHPRRKGRKTLNDWFKQAQIPSWLRQTAPLLQVGDDWLWNPVVGWLCSTDKPEIEFAQLEQSEPNWLSAAD
ncbi:MAG: tRNA lysidine(34) synthetase TilS [Pseudomonadota bacterium]